MALSCLQAEEPGADVAGAADNAAETAIDMAVACIGFFLTS
ncbi:hypothetical protein [Novosphingobium malaysiense]|nr:hypothetical protein [Novosphingobium malaysiense]